MLLSGEELKNQNDAIASNDTRKVLLSPILWLLGITLAGSFYMLFFYFYSGYILPDILMYISAALTLVVSIALWFALRQFERLQQSIKDAQIFKDAFEYAYDAQLILGKDGSTYSSNFAAGRFVTNRNEPLLASLDKMMLEGDREGRYNLSVLRTTASEGKSGEVNLRVYSPTNYNARMLIAATPLKAYRGMSAWRIIQNAYRAGTHQDLAPELNALLYVIDQIPIGIFTLGQDGNIVGINSTLANWLGYAPGEITTNKIKIDEFLLSQGEGQDEAASSNETPDAPQIRPVTLRDRKGVSINATMVKVALQNLSADLPQENPLRGGGLIIRQVDNNLALESAFKRARLLFKRFFEDAPVGIVLVDLNGRITEANRTFRKMMEKTLGKVEGRSVVEAIKKDDRERLANIFTFAVSSSEVLPILETKVLTAQEKVASLYIGRLEDEFGVVVGFVIHFVDVTEQKNLEVQFVQSQKMQAVGQLAGGIAHDFNNILTAIIGYCDLLLLRHRPGDQSFGDIQQIKQNSTRAANLVRQLLAFSRQQQLKPRVLNITDILSELANLLRRLIGENIKFNMIHGRDLWLLKVDQVQFEQVVINMVVNARDAMPKGGELVIKTQNTIFDAPANLGSEVIPAGEYVQIDVKDTGMGIARENLTRIFEPFFTTKGPGSGTGLGLSTVYGIVKQTDGFIVVDSTLQVGTTFTVYLPRHAGGEEVAAKQDNESDDHNVSDLTGVGTILLVEDEDAVRSFSTRALRNKGYKVLDAASGDAALKLILEQKPKLDLLVTDVMMPGMDGPALIREVRKIMPDIKVICISGYAEDALRDKIGGDQGIHFLPKPFSLKQLAGKVKELMDQ